MTLRNKLLPSETKVSRYNPLAMAVSLMMGAATLVPMQVTAEEAAEEAENANEGLEEVVVTARRTSENLQEVPVSVSSLNAAEMEAKGISTLNELQQQSPNTTLQVSRGTNSTLTAYIRGIGQQDPLWGFEPGVGIYIDDVYIARPQGAVLDVYDVDRIEVLRGPQGTLYGKNTIGGAVKYVTKKLTGEQELNVGAGFGSFGQQDYKISAQMPIAENFYVSAAVAKLGRDGFGESVTEGWDNYNKDVLTGRVTMQFEPTDSMLFKFAYDQTKDDSNAKGGYRLTPSIVDGSQVLDNVYDTRAGMAPKNSVETSGFSLSAEYQLSAAWDIKWVSASRQGETYTNIDFDNTAINSFDVPAIYEDEQMSHEFQALYNSGDLNGVFGLYSYTGNACGAFDVVLGLSGITLENGGCVDTESFSAFGQFTYDINDQLAMTLGGRYTADEKTADVYRYVYLGEVYPTDDADVFAAQTDERGLNESWGEFTPHASLEYKFTSDFMSYVSYSEGFKSGGFDMRANKAANPLADAPFGPEYVTTYEFGIKSEWMDNKVRMNAAVFRNDYTDMQVTSQRSIGQDQYASQVLNAGKSEATGAELELLAQVTDGLQLKAVLGLIDAEFTEFNSFDVVTGDPVNLADQWVISNTPDKTANFAATYNYPIMGGQLVSNLNWAFRGETSIFENESPLDDSNQWIANASVVYYSADDSWSVGLHGKNLGNEQYRVAGYYFPATFANDGSVVAPGLGGEDTVVGYYNDPRTVTLNVAYRF